MTYMYPSFARINVENVARYNIKYAVYRYDEVSDYFSNKENEGEGRRKKRTTLALFVPGNGGSYEQVRSLGHTTYALRVADSEAFKREKHHREQSHTYDDAIEWYAMDFNGESAALSADAVEAQIRTTREVLENFILEKRSNADVIGTIEVQDEEISSVVLVIGHSMGGLVAKHAVNSIHLQKLIARNGTRRRLVVITLATPHAFHPSAFSLSVFLNHAWRKTNEKGGNIASLFSISGGVRDWQVSGNDAAYIVRDNRHRGRQVEIQTVKSRISCDHLAICWCKQVVLSLGVTMRGIIMSSANETHFRNNQFLSGHEYLSSIPKFMRWPNFDEKKSIFIDPLSIESTDEDVNGRKYFFGSNLPRRHVLDNVSSLLVARTPNIVSAAIFWHVLFHTTTTENEFDARKKIDRIFDVLFPAFYLIFPFNKCISISAAEVKALMLEKHVAFVTLTVLASGYSVAKIAHSVVYALLSQLLKARREKHEKKTSSKTIQNYVAAKSISFYVAFSLAAPMLMHAYLIILKCAKKIKEKEKACLSNLAHSCCTSMWISLLLLPSFLMQLIDKRHPFGTWSLIDSFAAFFSALPLALARKSGGTNSDRSKMSSQIIAVIVFRFLALCACAASAGAGMTSLVHIGVVFADTCSHLFS